MRNDTLCPVYCTQDIGMFVGLNDYYLVMVKTRNITKMINDISSAGVAGADVLV